MESHKSHVPNHQPEHDITTGNPALTTPNKMGIGVAGPRCLSIF